MQKYLPKHLARKSIILQEFAPQKTKKDWQGKPSDWSDIRKNCPADSIALYAGVKSDYSAYDNLGFAATCTNDYNVFIDGTQYGTTYTSGTTCTITWSSLALTTGDDITTPEALKAHIIHIVPAQSGDTITKFQCKRVAASGNESQGVLWAHFNIKNQIIVNNLLQTDNTYDNKKVKAITAKKNILNCNPNADAKSAFRSEDLEYVPVIKNIHLDSALFSGDTKIENITLKSPSFVYSVYVFNNCRKLKQLKIQDADFSYSSIVLVRAFYNTMLQDFPHIDWTNVVNAYEMWTDYSPQTNNGTPTVIDARAGTNLKAIGIFNTKTLTGLRVSSSAPFDYATAPQIDVSYTGMDRTALVQLFNDLPTVSAGQIINITGATGADDLTAEDEAIATEKGWTITK